MPFSAQTRMSGVDVGGRQLRKGAVDAIRQPGRGAPAASFRRGCGRARGRRRAAAARPRWWWPTTLEVLGVIELKDMVKGGIRERFADLRTMGIRTVMITGDNRLTAAAIAAEAGVDDFLAEATPEDKLALIRRHQAEGKLVAMTGDGTNDAPALAQADVAVAMNSGTQAAKEAGNMVDLDSNPTKLIEIVEIGKQMLMTRGALTTFSMANDVAKYFAIVPAAFVGFYPQLAVLDVMRLGSPDVAILSAVIFNALILVALLPLALRGIAVPAARRGRAASPEPAGLRGGRPPGAVRRHQADGHPARACCPDSEARRQITERPRRRLGAFPAAHRPRSASPTRRSPPASPPRLFPHARSGSPAHLVPPPASTEVVGSKLVGQPFSAPGYFWGRPSATPERPYNPRFLRPARTSPPRIPRLAEQAAARAAALQASDPGQ